jgi:hypothetical protein
MNIGPRKRGYLHFRRIFDIFLRTGLLVQIKILVVPLLPFKLFLDLSVLLHQLVYLFHELLVTLFERLNLFFELLLVILRFFVKAKFQMLVRKLLFQLLVVLTFKIQKVVQGVNLLSEVRNQGRLCRRVRGICHQ